MSEIDRYVDSKTDKSKLLREWTRQTLKALRGKSESRIMTEQALATRAFILRYVELSLRGELTPDSLRQACREAESDAELMYESLLRKERDKFPIAESGDGYQSKETAKETNESTV